jgi:hypothetical protein
MGICRKSGTKTNNSGLGKKTGSGGRPSDPDLSQKNKKEAGKRKIWTRLIWNAGTSFLLKKKNLSKVKLREPPTSGYP